MQNQLAAPPRRGTHQRRNSGSSRSPARKGASPAKPCIIEVGNFSAEEHKLEESQAVAQTKPAVEVFKVLEATHAEDRAMAANESEFDAHEHQF